MSNLTDKEKTVLNGKNFVFVATINLDGSPQVSPVWVEVVKDLVWINTARGRVKERNLSRDPRVALSAYEQANPYDDVSLKGKVVEMTEEGAREHIDKLAHKYLGKPYPWHHDAENRVIIKIQKV